MHSPEISSEQLVASRFLAIALSIPLIDKLTLHPEGGETLIWDEFIHGQIPNPDGLSLLRHEETALRDGDAYRSLLKIVSRNFEIGRITNVRYVGPRRRWHTRGINNR